MKRIIFTFIAVLALAAMLPTSAATAASSDSTTLHGSAPAWANSHNFSAPADPNGSIGFRVYLGWNNSAAAEALAQAVSDPKSPTYGQYLTAAQFHQQFAPSQSDVGAGSRLAKESRV